MAEQGDESVSVEMFIGGRRVGDPPSERDSLDRLVREASGVRHEIAMLRGAVVGFAIFVGVSTFVVLLLGLTVLRAIGGAV